MSAPIDKEKKITKLDTPLTLADIAEPRPRDGTVAFCIRRALRKALYHQLLPRGIMRTVTIGGIQYRLAAKNGVDRFLLKRGVFEEHQIVFFFNEARARGARVFLDVGANFGYYSLLAARLGIFDEIHAFEPHPENYKRLLWHIKANNFESVITPHNVGANDAARDMRMLSGENLDGALMRLKDGDIADSVAVKTATLDSLFSFRGRNICVKIDTEGYEAKVLKGAENLLAHNDAFLQVEIWSGGTALIPEMLSGGFALIYHISDDFYFTNKRAGME